MKVWYAVRMNIGIGCAVEFIRITFTQQIIVYMESGAIPALLSELKEATNVMHAKSCSYSYVRMSASGSYLFTDDLAFKQTLFIAVQVFELSYIQQGILGGANYFCLSLACPLAGLLFRKCKPKPVLAIMLTCNVLAILFFAMTPVSLRAASA